MVKYINLVFEASSGIFAGYIRVQGTKEIHRFSTEANNSIPVAVHNLWLSDSKRYQTPANLELDIDFQSDEKGKLSIFVTGFIQDI